MGEKLGENEVKEKGREKMRERERKRVNFVYILIL